MVDEADTILDDSFAYDLWDLMHDMKVIIIYHKVLYFSKEYFFSSSNVPTQMLDLKCALSVPPYLVI